MSRENDRVKNLIRNSFFAVVSQAVLIVVGFFSTRVLNLRMGEALVGVNGVISNVLMILSVTELGFSTAVTFHLYRVLAERDEKEIARYMNLYRRTYAVIAMVILVLGLLLMPLLPYLMKENPFSDGYIRAIYLIFLLRTVCSYLLGYRRAILVADQKEYVASILSLGANVLNHTAIIVLVSVTGKYLPALFLNLVFEAGSLVIQNLYVEKQYPYLRVYRKERLAQRDRERIFTDIRNIFVSRLSIKLLVSTDNLIISGMISVVVNGLYYNYCLITNSVNNVVLSMANAMQPTLGNLFLEKDQEKNYGALRQMTLLFFFISATATASLASLMTPFVTGFWLSERHALAQTSVLLMSANSGVFILGLPIAISMAVTGLFDRERNTTVAAAVLNLGVSILLALPLGLSGVILGTLLANVIQIVMRFVYFFRDYLKRNVLQYLGEFCSYVLLCAGETAAMVFLTGRIYQNGDLLRFLLCLLLCLVCPLGVNLLLFFKTRRFQSMLQLLKKRR